MMWILNAVINVIGTIVLALILSDSLDTLIRHYPRYLKWLHWQVGFVHGPIPPKALELIEVQAYTWTIHRFGIGFMYCPNRKKDGK